MKTEISTSLNAIEPFVHPSLSSPVELHSGTNRSDASEEERKEVVGEDAPVDDSPVAYLCTARVAIIEELAAYKDEVHDAKIWAIRHSQERFEARVEAPPVRRQRVALHGKAYWTHDGNSVASPFATIALPSMFTGSAPEKAKSWADMDDDDDDCDFEIPWLQKTEDLNSENKSQQDACLNVAEPTDPVENEVALAVRDARLEKDHAIDGEPILDRPGDSLHGLEKGHMKAIDIVDRAETTAAAPLPTPCHEQKPTTSVAWADVSDDDEDIDMPDWLKASLEAQAAQSQAQNDSLEAPGDERVEERPLAEQRRCTSWADMMDEDDGDDELNVPGWLQQTARAYDTEIAALEDPASIGVALVDEPRRRCTVGRLHGSLYWTAIGCENRDSSLHYESMSEVDEVQTEDDAWDDDKTMEAIYDETAKLFGLPCYDVQQDIDEDDWQDDGRRPVDAARFSPFTTHGFRVHSVERPAYYVAGSILSLIDRSIWHSEYFRSVE
ncbi:hypothetical protein BCR37DRAFT_377010 [Protomyces lactucae-debilis]|uniref:Uncharacterized protein n=1 Tax=Protomyces lactucae-debilis TaxID=2754530 RepID=A0A1Y2FQW0_PROLT|nr:uncharacterized protein BCR37DRAFT_377010 [Protomyces lactucae-debilis]ORY86392.1 hypothetical protein BCR37DRAFT_377010 [Protomyces lactucae-debilis]